jgi:tetraacyldisaccharide 4'-kinase
MDFRGYFLSLATDRRGGIGASLIKIPLFLLSIVYGTFVRLLAFLYGLKPFVPRVKVISVGNITLGGTGKTMLVEYVARLLEKEGRRTAVLSRGYKRPGHKPALASQIGPGAGHKPAPASQIGPGVGDYEALGDEPAMLKKKFPGLTVLVNTDRVVSCRQAAALGADAAIIDDGFQQWRIRKDLDIVCIDAAGFGNGCVIPRGILREPLRALRRGHVFVLTNTRLVPPGQTIQLRGRLKQLNPSALIVESNHEPQGLYAALTREQRDPARLKSAALICGIGNPESFFDCCARAGIGPGPRFVFPDHHRFDSADIRRVVSACRQKAISAVVTTEKDEIRIPSGSMEQQGIELYVLSAALRITSNEQEFAGRLRGILPA